MDLGLNGAMDDATPDTGPGTPARSVESEDMGSVSSTQKKMGKSPPKRVLKSAAKAIRRRHRPTSRADVVTAFVRGEGRAGQDVEEEEEIWVQTRFIVRLKLSAEGTEEVQRILAEELEAPEQADVREDVPMADAPEELPTTAQPGTATPNITGVDASDVASTIATTQDSGSEKPARYLAPFERQWVDETKTFNMKTVLADVRAPGAPAPPLPDYFNWFPSAVPLDAIFPPGVPLSAKEIMAYYPHHIRWKGITLRLINNSYFGGTITAMQAFFRAIDKHPLTISNVNQFFRDTVRPEIPGFKVASYKGKPDRNLYTDHLKPRLINGHRCGFVVPKFEELLEGLVYLPTGLDARALTQCIVWYLNVRDTFTPRLELNVLHTQALIRALRVPLKSYGPQNLDMRALQEWKEKGEFAKRRVDDEVKRYECGTEAREELKRSRVTINEEEKTVGVDVVLKLRHVLTFPYLSIGGMVCKALEMGIEKAEARKAASEVREESRRVAETETVRCTEDVEMEDAEVEPTVEISQQEVATTTKIKQEAALPQENTLPLHHLQCSAGRADFTLVTIHTAKCSICDKPNTTNGMRRCKSCTWQICRPCQLERKQNGRSLAHGNLMPGPFLNIPTGYKIPKKRPLPAADTTEGTPTDTMPGLGVPGAPLEPRAMSNSIASRRFALIARRPPTMSSSNSVSSSRPMSPTSSKGPATAPASLFGQRRNLAPDHYHRVPYSSTFSNRTPRRLNGLQSSRRWANLNGAQQRVSTGREEPPRYARYLASYQPGPRGQDALDGRRDGSDRRR